jgi:hypothetical protein
MMKFWTEKHDAAMKAAVELVKAAEGTNKQATLDAYRRVYELMVAAGETEVTEVEFNRQYLRLESCLVDGERFLAPDDLETMARRRATLAELTH